MQAVFDCPVIPHGRGNIRAVGATGRQEVSDITLRFAAATAMCVAGTGAGFHSDHPAWATPVPERGNQFRIIADKGASTGQATVRFVKSVKDSGSVREFAKGCSRKMPNTAGMVLSVVFLQRHEIVRALLHNAVRKRFPGMQRVQ